MRIGNSHYTTIWINEDDCVQIIDQCFLPYQVRIASLTTVEECCHAISSMQVRGAGLIGITAAMSVYVAAKCASSTNIQEFQDYMCLCSAKLLQTRPTAKNLSWALERMQAVWQGKTKQEALPSVKNEAIAILHEDIEFCKSIGMYGLNIIEEIAKKKQGDTVNILTHCNAGWLAFGDYGSALSPIYMAQEKGIKVHVYVDETRPRNQGASLTAFELCEEGISHSLIADNTGGHLMQQGLVDMCIVGADRVTRCGDVANKIGTYLKALAAYDNNIPFYVALPSSTFDFDICKGSDIVIEQRGGIEVETLYGVKCDASGNTLSNKAELFRICPKASRGMNYAFDVTPSRLVTKLITDRGLIGANEEEILQMYKEKA